MRILSGYRCWIGNAGDLRNPQALHEQEIQAIIELADNEPFAALSRELIRCRFPLSDGGDNPDWLIDHAIQTATTFLHAQIPTLIACSAGKSRSVCLAAAGVACLEKKPFKEVLEWIAQSGPMDVSPPLFLQFQHALNRLTTPL